jgi:hypothetical protein
MAHLAAAADVAARSLCPQGSLGTSEMSKTLRTSPRLLLYMQASQMKETQE